MPCTIPLSPGMCLARGVVSNNWGFAESSAKGSWESVVCAMLLLEYFQLFCEGFFPKPMQTSLETGTHHSFGLFGFLHTLGCVRDFLVDAPMIRIFGLLSHAPEHLVTAELCMGVYCCRNRTQHLHFSTEILFSAVCRVNEVISVNNLGYLKLLSSRSIMVKSNQASHLLSK